MTVLISLVSILLGYVLGLFADHEKIETLIEGKHGKSN